MKESTVKAFFALLRAGLWEKEVCLSQLGEVDYNVVLRLAEEQSVVGLIAAGLEHVTDVRIPKDVTLQFVGQTLQLEQQNIAMNGFIAKLVNKMRTAGIYTLLIKGQGIAQCYERPLWRTCGDVDFLLSKDNYEKAKNYLLPLSSDNKQERKYSKEIGLNIGEWLVEIHGTQRTGLSDRIDKGVDATLNEIFNNGSVRSWMNDSIQVFLPEVDEDVFLVFTHFVKHFYKEVIGLRQICDWCRLMWTYRGQINDRLLGQRLRNAGLMAEWCAFAAFDVDYLGMPAGAIPLYCEGKRWNKKGVIIANHIVQGRVGSRFSSALANFNLFPLKTLEYMPGILFDTTWLKVKEKLYKK